MVINEQKSGIDPIRVPPSNIEAEQAILCSMLINPACRLDIRRYMSAGDFYKETHGLLFDVISDVSLDLVGIAAELQRKGILEQCGGQEYLMSLTSVSATSAHWPHYVEIVKSLSTRRTIIQRCQETMQAVWDNNFDVSTILSEHKKEIRELDIKETDYEDNRSLVKRAYETISERHKNQEHRVGVLTGYENIDERNHGLEPKTTFYLKGQSGMGKSALALNIGENIVSRYGGSVVYFTLESTALALTFRRFARHSQIALTRIRTGNIRSDGEWEDIVKACDTLYDNQMILVEQSRFRWLENIQAFCESYGMTNELLLVIIDFLQLLRTKTRHNSRHLELSYISDCLNYLAKDLDCPIFILSQVNKDHETKESRDIENNADNVWEIRREDKESEYATIRATKGKDSGTWETSLRFDRYIQRFYDWEE